MISPRSNHGFVTINGSVWAIGGTNGTKSISEVESLSLLEED